MPAAPRFAALPPLALYIHIPWCVRKCPYCDFNSHEIRDALPEDRYVEALIADLERALPEIWGRRIYSIFFGGGTPSVFSAKGIDAILSAVRARLSLAAETEITLEANPGTFEAEKFAAYRAACVNRLSIGIQSFSDRHLQALGRIHDAGEARRAIDIARRHFDNINLDLMYALPGQSVEEARADIAAALEYAPAHLSAYHLTIEPNTWFHRHPPRLPDDDASAAMQEAIESMLAAAGYVHYETSAFARPLGTPPVPALCRHNLNYWTFGDYLGIGAGAHSKISFADRIVREMRYKQPKAYMAQALAGNPVQTLEPVSARDVGFEFMMNALRLTDGFELRLFPERAGVPLNVVLPELEAAERRGFIARDHARVAPTPLGRRFLNDLLQLFLPEKLAAKSP
ncbi:MAG TPA: radical SAM family heme chaperone HemW [Burkholderiales bacterium]|nr:radical SAM family heme chaperone HemW [Burkholderiales bacterium]